MSQFSLAAHTKETMPLSREQLRQRFCEFDKNGDGKLTVTELREHISQLLNCQISQQAAQVCIN